MSRACRRQPQPLTTIESLLLAQAVWEHGAAQSSWSEIARILSQHPLLSRPESFFNPQSCHSMYQLLLKDADLEPNDLNNAAHAPMNLQLAQKHYHSRFLELRELIMTEELKFKTILREIEEIKVGLRGEVLNQRQEEEEEETNREAEGKEEEEASKGGDDRKEEEGENKEGEDQEMIIPSEEMENQEDMESNVIVGEGEEEESKEEETETNPVEEASKGEDDRKGEEEENKEEEGQEMIKHSEEMENQEEMESYVIIEEGEGEESKEEETETNPVAVDNSQERRNSPQGQDKTDVDHEQDDQTNNAELDMGSESEKAATPAEIPASPSSLNLAEAVDDEQTSGDELVMFTRRSSRRRKSSATSLPPPPTRKRLRSQGRISELEPQLTVDSENDSEIRDDYPQVDDDQISSPFDGSMTQRRDGKRKASFVESAESPPDKKRLREDSEPAEEEDPGPSSHTRTRATRHTMRTEEQVALKRFQNVISMLHSQISQHRNGNIFHNPIKNSEAPDYREIVKRPMDLKTIKTRVKDGVIANSLEFQRDIFLMFANAMMYNRPGSDVHAMAEDMMLESEGQILAFRQTEGLVKRGQRP